MENRWCTQKGDGIQFKGLFHRGVGSKGRYLPLGQKQEATKLAPPGSRSFLSQEFRRAL